jgi:hypothetical protein
MDVGGGGGGVGATAFRGFTEPVSLKCCEIISRADVDRCDIKPRFTDRLAVRRRFLL